MINEKIGGFIDLNESFQEIFESENMDNLNEAKVVKKKKKPSVPKPVVLKISNIYGNELELIQRLKKSKSPGKKALLNYLKINDWKGIYSELLFRIELYTQEKVLNYKPAEVDIFVSTIRKIGSPLIVTEMLNKYIPVDTKVEEETVEEETVKSILVKQQIKQQKTQIQLNKEEYEGIEEEVEMSEEECQELIEEFHKPYINEISLEDFTELCEFGMESFTDHYDIKPIESNEDDGFYNVIEDIQSHELAEQFEESGDDEVLQAVYSFLIQYYNLNSNLKDNIENSEEIIENEEIINDDNISDKIKSELNRILDKEDRTKIETPILDYWHSFTYTFSEKKQSIEDYKLIYVCFYWEKKLDISTIIDVLNNNDVDVKDENDLYSKLKKFFTKIKNNQRFCPEVAGIINHNFIDKWVEGKPILKDMVDLMSEPYDDTTLIWANTKYKK